MERMFNLTDIENVIEHKPLVLLVVKTSQCGVCDSVLAKVTILLKSRQTVTGIYVYMEDAPEIASKYLAFSAPTVLLFYGEKEVYRAARFVRFDELENVLARYEEA